ncbi:MAG: SGNH/GDSL hydrolase family protein [Victivallales bacterium]|nr:SGNH/GDSL hydrolase family protein [Victivallales bacterium]
MTKIVFIGDSVTDVGRSREPAFADCGNKMLGNGYPALVAARLLRDCPNAGLVFFNRGISGDRVLNLFARWRMDALNLQPDVLSILIGVNDTWHGKISNTGVSVERYGRVYRELLEWSKEELPALKLILMEPFVLPFGVVQADWPPEMAERQAIVRQLAKDFQTGFVPCQDILNEACSIAPPDYWLADGVHPTLAGHQLLADAWLQEYARIK